MYPKIDIISKTNNGLVFKCRKCNNYQVQFNNLSFSFSDEEYFYFSNYISQVDEGYYKHHYTNDICNRIIQLPIGHKSLMISLSIEELEELKSLFSHKRKNNLKPISMEKINYKLFMN